MDINIYFVCKTCKLHLAIEQQPPASSGAAQAWATDAQFDQVCTFSTAHIGHDVVVLGDLDFTSFIDRGGASQPISVESGSDILNA